MPFEPDKISSYYHKSAKPSFFFYRATVITSMVALVTVLGINLSTLSQPTSTRSSAAEPTPTVATTLTTPTLIPTTSTPLNGQALPPLPPQCHYEPGHQTASGDAATSGTTIKCTEGGKSCTYTIINNKYVMSCDQ